MSARDVTFTLMALGHVAGCRGKSDTEILAEAVGEIVRLQTTMGKIALESSSSGGDLWDIHEIATDALEYKEGK